jgi:predicted methyltransferase
MRRFALLLAGCLLALPLQAQTIPDYLTAAVATPERSAKDRERDAHEKPAELLAFAGVKPGMKVADFFGGGGYWSELISYAVGPTGSVTLVNNPGYFFFSQEGIKERFANDRLKSIKRRAVETGNLDLGSAQYDLVFIFMGYHDLYWVDESNGWPKIDAGSVLDQLNRALKPGGKLLIVDHEAKVGTGSSAAGELHRIEEAFAKKDITAHGFKLEKEWPGYRNTTDDHSLEVFDKAIRHKTDRFTHLYTKQ